MAFINPLDFRTWFIDTLAGSYYIFFALMFIFIAFLSIKLRAPSGAILIFLGLFVSMFISYYAGFGTLLIIILGLLLAIVIYRKIQQ